MIDSLLEIYKFQTLLANQSKREISIHIIDKEHGHVSLWASNNLFPLNAFNAHPTKEGEWTGSEGVINYVHNLETLGFSVLLLPREIGDETGHKKHYQDFKLVIRA